METADVVKALLGFLLGAVGSYLGLYWKVRSELEAQYDKDLRAERLQVYPALWKLLEPLAKYSRPGPVTALSLQKMSAELRQWYFEVGGLFMSERTRKAYFSLQDELVKMFATYRDSLELELSEENFENIRRKGSQLRTATTADVGSRQKPLIDDEASA